VRRVSVVGNSGSGKSTLARALSQRLGVDYIELDAIHHLENWEPIDPDEFNETVDRLSAESSWVIDGNYRSVVQDKVWQRADTVVWLDLPRRTVMTQVVARSLRRVVSREKLWNGNQESARNLLSRDPELNVVLWSWTQHGKYVERYSSAMTDPEFAHLDFVRLSSRQAMRDWLES
jgi:adenylate kinase family enzyme